MTASKQAMNILLIDDDAATQALVTMTLNHHGHTVVVVGSAAEAMHYVQNSAEPDLILLDLYLPDGDGFTTLKSIRQVLPTAKVVATTAYHTNKTEEEVQARGFDGYQGKPLRPGTFVQYLNEMME